MKGKISLEVVVLAGGKGTRLQSVVNDVPKPMAPIKEKPFLEYLLKYIISQGAKKVILSVGYKSQTIIDHFKESFLDCPIEYVIEEKPLGTGGAIKKSLEKVNDDNAVVLNGDTFFKVNLKEFESFHNESNTKLSLSLKTMKRFDRYGSVVVENGMIKEFQEKQYCDSGLINGGVYLINKNLMNEIDKDVFSFETEFLNPNKHNIAAYIVDEYFIDIGIPEDYYKAQTDLINEI